ncbi:glycosyltransferase family 4 protein [Sodaliphilus sp.]|uniref:glycosyltransferase family 4 protein n=1 Tax=Sodaliphilus sp. TaxID=2815818 RepID=UPI00388FB0F8
MGKTSYISKDIARQVLNVGPDFITAQGGIAQVAEYYNEYIFEDFNYLPNSCGGSKFNKLICLIKSVFRLVWIAVFKREIKVVHIHTSHNVSFKRSAIFVRLCKLMGLSSIMHIHSGAIIDYSEQNFGYVKKVLSQCTQVIVLAQMWKQYFEEKMNLHNVAVLENIVPRPAINRQRVGDGKMHFLFLGRLVVTKGVMELVNAIIENKDYFSSRMVLHLCGDGIEEAKLKNMVAQAGLEDTIVFEGWIVDEEKINLLNHCEVFILPTYFEGISISILESMTYHLAIVTTDVGGNPTLVENGKNGLLFPVESTQAVADAIRFCLDNPETVKRMGEASDEIVSKFYPESVSVRLAEIYSNILANRK